MEEEPLVKFRVMIGRASTATWGTRASHDTLIIHRYAPATLSPTRCKYSDRRSRLPVLRFFSSCSIAVTSTPTDDPGPHVHIRKWEIAARDLQDPEHRRPDIRRHTGTQQRTVWPTRRSSRGKRTSGFMSLFGSYRRGNDYL
jgi:hypothetical protein